MATYNLPYSGAQLAAAVGFGHDPDATPTQGSTKGVTSGGVFEALQDVQPTITMDDTVTQNSSNPVKSSGIYTALQGKQDTLTIDAVPTNGSNNPVASNGVYDAIRDITKLDTEGLSLTRTANALFTNVATKNIYKGDFFFLTEDKQTLCKAIRYIAAGDVLNRHSGPGTPGSNENYIMADDSPTTYFFQPMAGLRRAPKWTDGGSTRTFTMTEVGGSSNVLITYGYILPSGGGAAYVSYGVYLIFYTSYWTIVPVAEGTNHPTVSMDSSHTLTVTYTNVDSAKFGDCCLINLHAFPQDYV